MVPAVLNTSFTQIQIDKVKLVPENTKESNRTQKLKGKNPRTDLHCGETPPRWIAARPLARRTAQHDSV